MTQESPTNAVTVSSRPDHDGFLFRGTCEPVQQPAEGRALPQGSARFSPTIKLAADV